MTSASWHRRVCTCQHSTAAARAWGCGGRRARWPPCRRAPQVVVSQWRLRALRPPCHFLMYVPSTYIIFTHPRAPVPERSSSRCRAGNKRARLVTPLLLAAAQLQAALAHHGLVPVLHARDRRTQLRHLCRPSRRGERPPGRTRAPQQLKSSSAGRVPAAFTISARVADGRP